MAKTSGYVVSVKSVAKDMKALITLDNGLAIGYWKKAKGQPDFVPPKEGDYIDAEYESKDWTNPKTGNTSTQLDGIGNWAIQTQVPMPVASEHKALSQTHFNGSLSARDMLMARQNAQNAAVGLVIAKLSMLTAKGEILTHEGMDAEVDRQFILALNRLINPPSVVTEPLKSALEWVESKGLTPTHLDKFVQAYVKVHIEVSKDDVLKMVAAGKFDLGMMELAGE